MKKVLITLVVIVVVASFIGTGYFLYQKSVEPPVVYTTTSPFITSIEKKTVATGTIIPRREIEIKSQVPGIVETLFVEPGAKVKEGDIIAKIKIVPDAVAVNRAEGTVATAQINFNNAEQEMKRQQKLYDQKIIAKVELNRFALDYNLRKQELKAAQENLQLLEEGAIQKSKVVSNIVRSTIAGTILDLPVEEGNRVIESNTFNEGTTIAFIADMSDMIFEGQVDESEVGKIKVGLPLELQVGAIDAESFDAVLEFISPKGVAEEGAIKFEIRAAIQSKDEVTLRASYSANANIVLDRKDSVLAVKEKSLFFENDDVFVEVETGQQAFEKRQVETGISDGINIEIVSGIDQEVVIKENGDYGSPV